MGCTSRRSPSSGASNQNLAYTIKSTPSTPCDYVKSTQLNNIINTITTQSTLIVLPDPTSSDDVDPTLSDGVEST